MLQGLEALAADPATALIVLISKPPHPEVAKTRARRRRQIRQADRGQFLGADPDTVRRPNVHPVRTLEDAAGWPSRSPRRRGCAAARPGPRTRAGPQLGPGQKYIRGLYSGGTFCYEALLLLTEASAGSPRTRRALEPEQMLADVWRSERHTVIDLGDDAFTRGAPHPIDQTLRKERILKEAADPEVAVILFDVVLGYGAHPDPARSWPSRSSRRAPRGGRRRELALVGSVCGTAGDPQDLARQEARCAPGGRAAGREQCPGGPAGRRPSQRARSGRGDEPAVPRAAPGRERRPAGVRRGDRKAGGTALQVEWAPPGRATRRWRAGSPA